MKLSTIWRSTLARSNSKISAYYQLTKPGVLYGNVLTVVAGYLLAAQGAIDWEVFAAVTVGMTAVIGAACAINNYLDQDIDAKMARTKKRPSVTKQLSGKEMVTFATLLGLAGLAVLALWTNWLVVAAAIFGYITYVWLYGATSKRKSMHGTLVGSVSGAVPILAGYLAGSGVLDAGAVLVFLVLFFWQMPEFYSIAIYRRDEYKAAGVPVITVVRGIKETKLHIFFYTLAFVLSSMLLGFLGYAGFWYTIIMGILGVYWIYLGFIGLSTKNDVLWAKKMFKFSLNILLAFSLLISIDAYLP